MPRQPVFLAAWNSCVMADTSVIWCFVPDESSGLYAQAYMECNESVKIML